MFLPQLIHSKAVNSFTPSMLLRVNLRLPLSHTFRSTTDQLEILVHHLIPKKRADQPIVDERRTVIVTWWIISVVQTDEKGINIEFFSSNFAYICNFIYIVYVNHAWPNFNASMNGIFCLSVCLSVWPSVCLSVTPFWLCSHHRIIMKFSGVITKDQGNVHAKGQGQRSKVKVTEVTTQLNRFRTVTPVWIHIRWWNDTYSLMLLRRGALLFFKGICQISRSHGWKHRRIWPRLSVSGL